MKLSFRASAHTGVGIPRMFGNLQEGLRPVHKTGLKPWGIATPACTLVRNDSVFSARQIPIDRFAVQSRQPQRSITIPLSQSHKREKNFSLQHFALFLRYPDRKGAMPYEKQR